MPKIKSQTIATIDKGDDETKMRVTTETVDDVILVQIRDYYPSVEKTGHGIVFPRDLTKQVIAALNEIEHS